MQTVMDYPIASPAHTPCIAPSFRLLPAVRVSPTLSARANGRAAVGFGNSRIAVRGELAAELARFQNTRL